MSRRDDPFDEIEQILDRLSQEFTAETAALGGEGVAVDVADHGDEFVVTADLPGFESDDIDVELRDTTLSVGAERTEERDDDVQYLRQERRTESVSRSVSLPEPVAEAEVSASHSNGVLTVTLPKRSGDGEGYRIDID